jgi:hypothetical protein
MEDVQRKTGTASPGLREDKEEVSCQFKGGTQDDGVR